MMFLIPVVIAGLVVLTTSCDDDDILTQDFNVTLSKEFVVNSSDTNLLVFDTLDASAESDVITRYGDHIQDLTLQKVTYEVTAHTGPADQKLIAAFLDVAERNGQNRTNLSSVSNVNLASALNSETQLYLEQAGIDLAKTNLKSDPWSIAVFFTGVTNTAPIDFTVKFRFYIKIKAEII